MPAAAVAVLGLYGLVVGSFLNVVISRVPAGASVTHPRSACPSCGTPIRWRDLAPVASWVALGGRCRHCSGRISARYPAVELAGAGLFVLVALRFGWSPTLPAMAAWVSGLLALGVCDLERLLLPKAILYPTSALVAAALLGAAAATVGGWGRLAVAAACAGAAWLLFGGIHLVSPRALGFGDVRFAPLVFGPLGWLGVDYAVLGFLLANFLGAATGLVLIAAGRHDRKTPLPYGLFLAAGGVVALVLGQVVHYPL